MRLHKEAEVQIVFVLRLQGVQFPCQPIVVNRIESFLHIYDFDYVEEKVNC
jgi:hypothetical protein